MSALLTTFLVLALFSSVLSAVTHFAVLKALRRKPAAGHASASTPAISVLKPLKGSEPDLYENLASFARQDYPNFELVIGAEAEDDPALSVARRVARDFPQVSIRVGSGSDDVGLNPKVRILKVLSARARHDVVLVSDACVHADARYLHAMAAELVAPDVGLVSSVLVGCGERTLGARLDNLHMNSFIVRGVCGGAELAQHPCVIGKSMLLRKSELAKLGGFSLVEDVLAEDYVLGQRFAGAGYRVVLSAHRLASICRERTVGDFFARHLRWSQMRRHLAPSLYFFEPLLLPLPWLLAVAVLLPLSEAGAEWPRLLACLGIALRLFSDATLTKALRGRSLSLADYGALLVKDWLCLVIWFAGALKDTVQWRGTSLRIGPGSRLFPLTGAERPAPAPI
jgi:ceramide glucosyltransferase